MLKYTDIERKNDVVCIVATGYAWDQCVFGIQKKDYWTLNNMYDSKIDPNIFDEWFQIHRPGTREGHVDDAPMRDFLARYSKPCWVQQDWGAEMEVKNPALYPIDEIVNTYCPKDVTGEPYPYFTNSIDYMMTLAMLRGYKEIQFYGVEFVSDVDDEYYKMRQSVNFYAGQCKALGIKLVVQNHSSMLKAGHFYGYEPARKDRLEDIMQQNLQKVIHDQAETDKKIAELEKLRTVMEGGKQTLEQTLRFASLRDKGCQI